MGRVFFEVFIFFELRENFFPSHLSKIKRMNEEPFLLLYLVKISDNSGKIFESKIFLIESILAKNYFLSFYVLEFTQLKTKFDNLDQCEMNHTRSYSDPEINPKSF